MGFKGFSLKLFNANNKDSPTGQSSLPTKSASENEPREGLSIVANGPSDELASNAKFERLTDRPQSNRKSPRKKEDYIAEVPNAAAEVVRAVNPSPEKLSMDKPVLKLFLKSSDSTGKTDPISSSSSIVNEKKEIPTLLRLRISSSEEKLPKQEPTALLIESQLPLPEPNRPISPVKSVRKYKKKQADAIGDTVVRQKRPYKKRIKAEEEPKDIFNEPQGKLAKREKLIKAKKEKKPRKQKQNGVILKEKKIRRSKKQQAVEVANPEAKLVVAEARPHDQEENVKMLSEGLNFDIINEDFCAACKNTGYFICCETCPNSFHLACVFPPLASVPEESWQCIDCLKSNPAKRLNSEFVDAQVIVSSINEIENYRAMWDRVWAMTILSEPSTFNLPKKLRPKKELPLTLELLDESAYQIQPKRRVSLADIRKSSSSSSLNGARRSAGNRASAAAPAPTLSRRIAESGQCHHCGQRSIIPDLLPLRAEPIVPKPLLRCDGCPLLWHMDCIDPPLTVLPSADKRWLCPAHVKLPLCPNFIPDVDLEDNDPFSYEMITRLSALQSPPSERVRVSESSIRLDFGAKAHRLREESKLNPIVPPPDVSRSYATITEALRL